MKHISRRQIYWEKSGNGLISLLFLLPLFMACQTTDGNGQSERSQLLTEMQERKQALRELAKQGSPPADSVLALAYLYVDFAEQYPKDSLAPELLFSAADLMQGHQEAGKAIKYWGQVWRNYPEHPKAPEAIFMQAFVFETRIGDVRNAGSYYRKLTRLYPEHPMAAQAEAALKVLGKDPQELIREFEKNR